MKDRKESKALRQASLSVRCDFTYSSEGLRKLRKPGLEVDLGPCFGTKEFARPLEMILGEKGPWIWMRVPVDQVGGCLETVAASGLAIDIDV